MKGFRFLVWVAIALLAAGSGAAWSHGGHFRGGHHHHHHGRAHFGLFIGVPLFVPRYYYPPPVYDYPPPTYIYPAPPAPPAYRYYCPDSRAYYPDVRDCPSDWLRVVPSGGAPAY